MFVSSSQQKQGRGKKLSKKIIGIAIEKYNIKNVYLVTFSEKSYLLDWYSKLGFKKDNHWVVFEGDSKQLLGNLGGK